jgi:hypothetical protein
MFNDQFVYKLFNDIKCEHYGHCLQQIQESYHKFLLFSRASTMSHLFFLEVFNTLTFAFLPYLIIYNWLSYYREPIGFGVMEKGFII